MMGDHGQFVFYRTGFQTGDTQEASDGVGGRGTIVRIKRKRLEKTKQDVAREVIRIRRRDRKKVQDASGEDLPCIWSPATGEAGHRYSKCIKGLKSEFPSALSMQKCIQGQPKCAPREIRGVQRRKPEVSSWKGWTGTVNGDENLFGDIKDWLFIGAIDIDNTKQAAIDDATQSIIGEYLFGSTQPNRGWNDEYKLNRLKLVVHTPDPAGQNKYYRTAKQRLEDQRAESLLAEWMVYTQAAGDEAYAYTHPQAQSHADDAYVSDNPNPFDHLTTEQARSHHYDHDDDHDNTYLDLDEWE